MTASRNSNEVRYTAEVAGNLHKTTSNGTGQLKKHQTPAGAKLKITGDDLWMVNGPGMKQDILVPTFEVAGKEDDCRYNAPIS